MADDPIQNQTQTGTDEEEKNVPEWLKKARALASHEENSPEIKKTTGQANLSLEPEIDSVYVTTEKNANDLAQEADIPEWLKKVQQAEIEKDGSVDLLESNELQKAPVFEESVNDLNESEAPKTAEETQPSEASLTTNESEVPKVPEETQPSEASLKTEESEVPKAVEETQVADVVVEPMPEILGNAAAQEPQVAVIYEPPQVVSNEIGAPEGMLEVKENEIDALMREKRLEEESNKPIPDTELPSDDKAKAEKQKKAEMFHSAKNIFVDSIDKVQKAIDEGRSAGVPKNPEVKDGTTEAVTSEAGLKDVKKKVTEEEKQKLIEAEKIYQNGLSTIRDLISPSSMEIRYESLRVEGVIAQSFYVYSYPRYLDANWLSPVINFDVTMDISQFIYPIDSAHIMKVLRKKVTQMHSSVRMMAEKGIVSDPALETSLQDAEELRVQIQRGQEKLFQFGLYFTIYTDDERKIIKIAKQLESMLGSKLIMVKKADLQHEHAFNSVIPQCLDELEVNVNMNTSPLSTTFPFSSSDLTSNEGILYGLNRHNDSLIIFDRFSLENANSVVFAKSGAGKSYAVKLEILRSMMVGTDVIVIDPENEYEALCQTVGGAYLKVSLTSDRRINPFDLPAPLEDEELQPGDLLRSNIISLHGLLKIMLGGVNAEEESILDKALIDVYALKGITMDLVDPSSFVPPTMEDLQSLLSTMEGGLNLSQRLQKYTVGTYSGIFNKPTNVDLKSGLMIFCIRDLEDALRPIAMYIILNYIWNKIRSKLKKRILVVDEAWTMMQHEDSAKFMFGLVKRARKYYLGITTITQDVEDFIKSPYGKPVVTNSSLQLLLKQAPAAIDLLAKVFNLTDGEKYMLLNSGVGQGLFFAGLKHVAIQIIASYTEDKIVTTNPEEILKERADQLIK
jgi:conjugal transfer ATP-binding protein TraC